MDKTIKCWDECGDLVSVMLVAGDSDKGIGYCDGAPVLVFAREIQPAPKPGERWLWTDRDGNFFKVFKSDKGHAYWGPHPRLSAGSGALMI